MKWWGAPHSQNPILDTEILKGLLSKKTRLVACTHTSNILGTISDIKKIAATVHTIPGAMLCVDGVAYAPHRQIDMRDLDADFYSFSWYKVRSFNLSSPPLPWLFSHNTSPGLRPTHLHALRRTLHTPPSRIPRPLLQAFPHARRQTRSRRLQLRTHAIHPANRHIPRAAIMGQDVCTRRKAPIDTSRLPAFQTRHHHRLRRAVSEIRIAGPRYKLRREKAKPAKRRRCD